MRWKHLHAARGSNISLQRLFARVPFKCFPVQIICVYLSSMLQRTLRKIIRLISFGSAKYVTLQLFHICKIHILQAIYDFKPRQFKYICIYKAIVIYVCCSNITYNIHFAKRLGYAAFCFVISRHPFIFAIGTSRGRYHAVTFLQNIHKKTS